MKTIFVWTIALTLLSGVAQAQQQFSLKQNIINQTHKGMTSDCQDAQFLSCSGMSKKVCTSFVDKAVEKCLGSLPHNLQISQLETFAPQIESCMLELSAAHGLDQEAIESCNPE